MVRIFALPFLRYTVRGNLGPIMISYRSYYDILYICVYSSENTLQLQMGNIAFGG